MSIGSRLFDEVAGHAIWDGAGKLLKKIATEAGGEALREGGKMAGKAVADRYFKGEFTLEAMSIIRRLPTEVRAPFDAHYDSLASEMEKDRFERAFGRSWRAHKNGITQPKKKKVTVKQGKKTTTTETEDCDENPREEFVAMLSEIAEGGEDSVRRAVKQFLQASESPLSTINSRAREFGSHIPDPFNTNNEEVI